MDDTQDMTESGGISEPPAPESPPAPPRAAEPPPPPPPPAPDAPPPPGAPFAPQTAGGRPGPASETSKILAAIGYPIWIVALIAILIDPYKNERFVKFHAVQALGLSAGVWIVVTALSMTGILGLLAIPIGFLAFIYEIVLAVKAFNGEYFEVPVVYGFVKGWMGE